jgi:hypothetical protein
MPEFSGGIPPLLKKPIMARQFLRNVFEQLNAHPETASKVGLGVCGILHKLVPHQSVVGIDPFPPQFLTTENRTTVLRLFIDVHS